MANEFPGYNSLPPYLQSIVDRIQQGQYDFTYGPGSPDPTREDLNTIYGNNQNVLKTGNYALAPVYYNAFTPAQRAALGIADLAPSWHGTKLERFFGRPGQIAQQFWRGAGLLGNGPIKSGPFEGWTPQEFNQWHNGPGESQMGYPTYEGTDPASGYHSQYPTTWYNDPQYGWVPQAQLANPQASLNLRDYFFPQGGPGTGVPTQKVGGAVAGAIANAFVPGLGFVVSPLARMLIKAMQGHGGGSGQSNPASPEAQPSGSSSPFGGTNPYPQTQWSPFGGLPPGFIEGNRFDGGAPTFTYAPGFTGPNWAGGSIFNANDLSGLTQEGFTGNKLSGVHLTPLAGAFAGLGAGGGGQVSGGFSNALSNTMLRHLYKFGMPTTFGYNSSFYNVPGAVSPGYEFGRNILLSKGITGLQGGNQGNFTGRALKSGS